MSFKTVITDHNLLEKIQYQNNTFPISFYEDCLDDYLNGEINHHWHEEFEFGIIIKGEMEYCIHQNSASGDYRILKEGDGVFINSKALHSARQTVPGTVLFDFVIPTNFFVMLSVGAIYQKNILPIVQSSMPGLFLSPQYEADTELLYSLKEFYHLSSHSPGYELHCIELVCKIWRQLLDRISLAKGLPSLPEAEHIQEQRVRLMLSYIHAHYGEDITINTIAESANVSRSECFRSFRTIIGKSPAEYLCSYRLSQAAHMLFNTDNDLSEICYSCGFNSPSYFGKLFRENCGMSPGQYRGTIPKRMRPG